MEINKMTREELKAEKTSPNYGERFYLFTFAIVLTILMVRTTTIPWLPGIIDKFLAVFVVFCIFTKVMFFDNLTWRRTQLELLLIIVSLISGYLSGNHWVFLTTLMIIGANGVSFKKILRIYIVIVVSIMVIAFLLSTIHIIPNLTFQEGTVIRRSFGAVYPTDFSAHIFYLLVAYSLVRGSKFSVLDFIPYIISLFVIYKFTNTANDIISIVVLIIVIIFYRFRNYILKNRFFSKVFNYSFLVPIISFIFIVDMTMSFNIDNPEFISLNNILTNRLSLGNQFNVVYGITAFGQKVQQIGWGGVQGSNIYGNDLSNQIYNFMDSSYINMLISYGLVFTVILILGITFYTFTKLKKSYYLIPLLFASVAISSIIDQHMFEPAYNILLFLFFAKQDVEVNRSEEKAKWPE